MIDKEDICSYMCNGFEKYDDWKNVNISLLIAEFERCWFVTNEMSP